MTALWDAGPCDWPDDPAELDRQLALAEAGYWTQPPEEYL